MFQGHNLTFEQLRTTLRNATSIASMRIQKLDEPQSKRDQAKLYDLIWNDLSNAMDACYEASMRDQ